MTPVPPQDIVIVSTADWDNPFWTNKQHVAVQLARLGHRVLYIDSLALRRPSASGRDLKRIGRRLLKAARRPVQVRNTLWVWSPIVLPLHRFAAVRRLNRLWLGIGLRLWMARLGLRHDMIWTYNPLTMALFDIRRFTKTVYHCVDEIKAQPGMPADVLGQAEEQLARAVRIVFVTSPALARSRRGWNTNTLYLPNVADFEHFSQALDSGLAVPADLARLPGPKLGFIGAISAYKVDFELICKIAAARPDWSLVLIGDVGEGDPWTDAGMLNRLPNIHLLGPRPYKSLPAYLKGFDVALLPYMLNDYTANMFPMKFFEYLAAGKPVVSVDLDAVRDYADTVYIAESVQAFIAGIEDALQGAAAPLAARLALARQHTYEQRTARMLELINAEAHP